MTGCVGGSSNSKTSAQQHSSHKPSLNISFKKTHKRTQGNNGNGQQQFAAWFGAFLKFTSATAHLLRQEFNQILPYEPCSITSWWQSDRFFLNLVWEFLMLGPGLDLVANTFLCLTLKLSILEVTNSITIIHPMHLAATLWSFQWHPAAWRWKCGTHFKIYYLY